MKEEISKLKVKLEEAQVQAVMYNELCCNAEVVVADVHKQYDELSNDLQQLLEFIQKEKMVKSKESTPDLKTWVIRLKQKHRKPKRLPGYVYDEIKILREPRKAKVDGHEHVVVSTEKNKPCKEAADASTLVVHGDESKGKQQLGTTVVGHNDVGGKRQISATMDPSCMSVWIYLSNEEQDRLHHFLICTDSGVPLWQGLYSAVYKDDLKDLLTEAAVTCNVIDSFAEILQIERSNNPTVGTKSHMMTTFCWEFLQKGDDKNIRLFLHDPLLEALAEADYILFPMRHASQYHFTLLVLHKEEEQWFHYDPRHSITKSSIDPCFANAQKLRDAVTTFLQFNSCIASNVLNNGHRMRLSEKDGGKTIQSPLTHGEKKTLQWLQSTDSNYPLWPSTSCPRQLDDSVDCGVSVMYFMWTISKGQNMVLQFTENTMKEYRAKIISKFINDGKSWRDD